MMPSAISNDFATSLALERTGPGQWTVPTSQLYWNLIGPFGGWIAAIAVKAVVSDDAARGEPVETHVRFMSACKAGSVTVSVKCISQGKSIAFWRASLSQPADSGEKVFAEVSILMASARATMDVVAHAMPTVPPPVQVKDTITRGTHVRWLGQFNFKYLSGLPFSNDETDTDRQILRSLAWVAHASMKGLDWSALIGLADVPVPRIFLLQTQPSPVSTVSMTTYFHIGADELSMIDSPWVLIETNASAARRGYFDHHAKLWSENGRLLATTTQLAWFA